MTRCLTTGELSAWLDHEVLASEAGRIAAHLSSCPLCRRELLSLEQGMQALKRLPRAEPPAWLAARVRERIAAAEPPPPLWRQLWEAWAARWAQISIPTMVPALSTVAVVAIVLAGCATNLTHNLTQLLPWRKALEPRFNVQVAMGEDIPFFNAPTEAKVAGRTFEFNYDVWTEKGVRSTNADLRVEAQSTEGRAILASYSGVDILLKDGPVLLRDGQRRTVELVRSL